MITRFEFEKADLNRIHKTELQRERESHQSEVAQTKTKHEEILWKASENAAKERRNIEQQHKEATEALIGSFAWGKTRFNQMLQSAGKYLDRQLAAEKDRVKDEIARLISSVEGEKARMWKIFRDREDQTKGFETQTADPKIDNEVLKGALVAGQHFKSLTDPELASRFKSHTRFRATAIQYN